MQPLLPKLKKEFEWLQLPYANSLQVVVANLDKAIQNSFSKKAARKGFPKFKSKHTMNDSMFYNNQGVILDKFRIDISKIGWIKCRGNREIDGKLLSATVSQDGNDWYCSILYELQKELPIHTGSSIGIDLGLSHFLTTSDGEVIDNPRFFRKTEKKLARVQRKLSRKKKGSSNRFEQRMKIHKIHKHIRNQRKDFLHKVTADLIAKNSVIVMEDLNVKGMVKNRKLSKSISDVGWSECRRQLQYKAKTAGTQVVLVDRFFPSSQLCSSCGNRQKMPLQLRIFNCKQCDASIDRDCNAAINILKEGINESNNRQGYCRIYACGDTNIGDWFQSV